jgi:hypothetical protein
MLMILLVLKIVPFDVPLEHTFSALFLTLYILDNGLNTSLMNISSFNFMLIVQYCQISIKMCELKLLTLYYGRNLSRICAVSLVIYFLCYFRTI